MSPDASASAGWANRRRPRLVLRPFAATYRLLRHASPADRSRPSAPVYWRVEGSLLELTTVRPIAFFTWNSQTFIARAARRSLVLLMALLRPFLYAANRVAATRIVHAVLRGVTRDRLDLLGEEEFEYKLKPLLKEEGVRHLKALQATGADVVLVSQGLDHVMRPLARHLGVRWIIANRLDFRDGVATGRLLSPVIRPRGLFARIREAGPDGTAESGALGACTWLARSQGAGVGDCADGAGGGAAGSSDCLFRRKAVSGAVFGAEGTGRESACC